VITEEAGNFPAIEPQPKEEQEKLQMKKKMIVLLAAALMTLCAGNAFAATYWGDGDLMEVFFDTSQGKEFSVDLGTLNTTNGGLSYTLTLNSGVLNYTYTQMGFAAGSTTQVSFYGTDLSNVNGLVSNSPTTAPSQVGDIVSTIATGAGILQSYWGGTHMTAQGPTSATDSFNNIMRGGGTEAFAGFIRPTVAAGSWEPNLSTAAAANLGIWSISDPYSGGTGAVIEQFLASVSIDASGDETTTISSPNATPIPAAAYLLGSGLLGLFGLRRKGNKA
jgi:hypothetical protein